MSNSFSTTLRPFLGPWRLDPAESRYERGQPPLDGAYTVAYDGQHLHFDIEWTGQDGKTQRQSIDAIADGQEHPYTSPAVDSVCYTLVDAATLDSTASKAGQVGAHARRLLLERGAQREIIQSGPLPGGGKFINR